MKIQRYNMFIITNLDFYSKYLSLIGSKRKNILHGSAAQKIG